MKPVYLAKIVAIATAVLAGIFVLLPFHALLTVWGASLVGHYTLLRLWKEILLLLLVPLALVVFVSVPRLRHRLEIGWLFWAIIFYAVLQVLLGLLALAKHQVNLTSLGDAWILDLRFPLIFLLAIVFATQSEWLKIHWRQLLLWPATLVVLFGLLQIFVLPTDFLRHFGYGPQTIAPFETVDQKLSYVRVQSTLRGANPFGAYLVLVISTIVVALLRRRLVLKKRLGGLVFLLASLGVLAATYSRSAYLGVIVSMLVLLWVFVHKTRMRRWLLSGLAIAVVIVVAGFAGLRHNQRFENTFFHTDQTSASLESSNESRASAMEQGVHDVLHEPFGRGPGTAGPASAHNVQPARIAENYYLQIGQEVGWIGLLLFIAINYMVVRRLWRRRNDPLARPLFISFLGITLINFLSHAWTDDTLSLLWWGFAGVALAPAILEQIKVSDATKKPKVKKTLAPAN